MTADDLIAALQALPEEQRKLPLAKMVWRDGDDFPVLAQGVQFHIETTYDPQTENNVRSLTLDLLEWMFE